MCKYVMQRVQSANQTPLLYLHAANICVTFSPTESFRTNDTVNKKWNKEIQFELYVAHVERTVFVNYGLH